MDMIRVMMITQDLGWSDTDMGLAARTAWTVQLCGKGRMQAALAYMKKQADETETVRDGVLCCPVSTRMKLTTLWDEWESTREDLLRVIASFRPDVIHVFGSEWIYGAVAKEVRVPVVIHMLGFLTVYYTALELVRRESVPPPKGRLSRLAERMTGKGRKRNRADPQRDAERTTERISGIERDIMRMNRYFMGRTQWDRMIVRYYAPGAVYFHVEEVIRPKVYDAAGTWTGSAGGRLRLLTISSGDLRKGSEIILRTAKILRDVVCTDFEWRVAGDPESFRCITQAPGIRPDEVNVKSLGVLDAGQIIGELQRADLFIHPSVIDNSPHAVCEAQLIGCPVIASRVGGLTDLIEDGATGFLYPYNEPHTLAFLIDGVCRRAGERERVSQNALREALRRHDPGRIAEDLYRVYRDVVKDYETGQDSQGHQVPEKERTGVHMVEVQDPGAAEPEPLDPENHASVTQGGGRAEAETV